MQAAGLRDYRPPITDGDYKIMARQQTVSQRVPNPEDILIIISRS